MGLKQMLLDGTDEHDLTKLAEYQSIGGYGQVEKARAMTADDLIAIVGSLDTLMGEVDR